MIWFLTIAGYFLIGLVGARIVRNSMLNHYYDNNLTSRKKIINKAREEGNYIYADQLEKNLHKWALDRAKDDFDDDMDLTLLLFFFWPAFLVIAAFYLGGRLLMWLIQGSFLPKSRAEKEVKEANKLSKEIEELKAAVELEKEELNRIMRIAEEAGINTEGMQAIADIRGASIKS